MPGPWGLGLLALLVFLTGGATQAEAAETSPLRLIVRHQDELGYGFSLRAARFTLDGRPLEGRPPEAAKSAEVDAGTAPIVVLDVKVEGSGEHWLELEYVYEGRSSLFNYIQGYRLYLRGRISFDALPDHVLDVSSRAYERDGVTLMWTDRPALSIAGSPSKLVRDIQSSSVGAGSDRAGVGAPEPSVASLTPEQEEALAQQAVDEVLREAEARVTPRCGDARPCPGGRRCEAGRCVEAPKASGLVCAPGRVQFPFARVDFSEDSTITLREMARCLASHPAVRLRIEGHCDVRGSEAVNLRLGLKRAAAAAAFFQREGIVRERLDVISRGERQPLCHEQTEDCHARNRRGELLPANTPMSSAGSR